MRLRKSITEQSCRAETLLVLLPVVTSFVIASKFNLNEKIDAFLERFEYVQLDELFVALAVGAICLVALSARRASQLRSELRRRRRAEREARALARHDPLTGLYNRRVVTELIDDGRPCGPKEDLSLLMIDLDRFKPVNDTYGHHAGDVVLCTIADRLRSLGPNVEGIGRLGGDEFAVVLRHPSGGGAPESIARRLIDIIAEPIMIGETLVEVGASIGIASCKRSLCTAKDLLRAADIALYRAKGSGRGTFCAFEFAMEEEIKEHATLEADLRLAIRRSEIVPYYQPIVCLASGELVGFECLARWRHPVRGMVMPDCFIPIAEDAGLIHDLSFALLRHACEDMHAWPAGLSLSFNLSPLQLRDRWLSQRILQILSDCGIAPARLIVEITESRLLADIDAARGIIASLKNMGVKVSLDDFGTGYASLRHLRELQFDRLKIDRSFVQEFGSAKNGEIVRAILSLGGGLGMSVTAEGVETSDSANLLSDLGCAFAQGYLFSPPVPADEALAMTRSDTPQRWNTALPNAPIEHGCAPLVSGGPDRRIALARIAAGGRAGK